MKKILLALVALLCTIGVSAQDNDSIYEKNLLKPGTPAPIIPLDGKDGSKYGLHQFQKMTGNYMVVYFYAGWCPDCRKVAPDFVQKIQKDYKSLNISPFYVSFDKDSTTFKEYREKEDMHGMVFLETKKWKESKVAMDYHLEWIPTFYLITPDGKVDFATINFSKLMDRIEQLKKEGKIKESDMKLPQFFGGTQRLLEYLSKNLQYPSEADRFDFEGRVIMKFSVNEDGSISDISCIKAQGTKPYSKKFLALPESEQKAKEEDLLKLMAKESYRVVKNMPRWIPGTVSGKPVKTSFNLPITFKLTKKK